MRARWSRRSCWLRFCRIITIRSTRRSRQVFWLRFSNSYAWWSILLSCCWSCSCYRSWIEYEVHGSVISCEGGFVALVLRCADWWLDLTQFPQKLFGRFAVIGVYLTCSLEFLIALIGFLEDVLLFYRFLGLKSPVLFGVAGIERSQQLCPLLGNIGQVVSLFLLLFNWLLVSGGIGVLRSLFLGGDAFTDIVLKCPEGLFLNDGVFG